MQPGLVWLAGWSASQAPASPNQGIWVACWKRPIRPFSASQAWLTPQRHLLTFFSASALFLVIAHLLLTHALLARRPQVVVAGRRRLGGGVPRLADLNERAPVPWHTTVATFSRTTGAGGMSSSTIAGTLACPSAASTLRSSLRSASSILSTARLLASACLICSLASSSGRPPAPPQTGLLQSPLSVGMGTVVGLDEQRAVPESEVEPPGQRVDGALLPSTGARAAAVAARGRGRRGGAAGGRRAARGLPARGGDVPEAAVWASRRPPCPQHV